MASRDPIEPIRPTERQHWAPEIEARIRMEHKQNPGIRPAEVSDKLKDEFTDKFGAANIPATRTIRRRLDAYRKDFQEPWTPITATDFDEAALVLPVLGALTWWTRGAIKTLTNREADYIARVRRLAPDLMASPHDAEGAVNIFCIALDYEEREGHEDTADLDLYLAVAPWRKLAQADDPHWWSNEYHSLVTEGSIPRARFDRFYLRPSAQLGD